MRLNSSGDLGVGELTPNARLHVNQADAAPSLLVQDGGVTVFEVGDGNTIGFFNTTPAAQDTGWSVTVSALRTLTAESTLSNVIDVLGTVLNYLLLRGDISA